MCVVKYKRMRGFDNSLLMVDDPLRWCKECNSNVLNPIAITITQINTVLNMVRLYSTIEIIR
jgi:hypothetical protein